MHPLQRSRSLALSFTLAAALVGGSGCVGQTCDTHGEAPQRYSGGRTNRDRSFYETSNSNGPFLFFPAGRTYRFEHGLSETPAEYHAVMAWFEYPLESAGISESAGNQAMFELIDEKAIEVRNDTCADLYLRLWARVAPFELPDAGSASPRPDENDASSDADSGNADAGGP